MLLNIEKCGEKTKQVLKNGLICKCDPWSHYQTRCVHETLMPPKHPSFEKNYPDI